MRVGSLDIMRRPGSADLMRQRPDPIAAAAAALLETESPNTPCRSPLRRRSPASGGKGAGRLSPLASVRRSGPRLSSGERGEAGAAGTFSGSARWLAAEAASADRPSSDSVDRRNSRGASNESLE